MTNWFALILISAAVFDSIEDAAWNAAVAEVERERELEDIGEEDVRYDENGNVLNNPAAREEYRNTAAAASNSGNSPLSRFDYSLPVRAYYLGSTVDFRRLARELPTYPKEFTRECVVIRLAARRSVELASGGVGGLQIHVQILSEKTPQMRPTSFI